MCEYKLKAAHSLDARHDVDKQGLLTICFGVLAELLLEGCLRRQGAEDASSESSGLGFEPEGLETELDDIIKILPRVDGVRAGPLNRNGDDLVAADEVLGQTVARLASLASWKKKTAISSSTAYCWCSEPMALGLLFPVVSCWSSPVV